MHNVNPLAAREPGTSLVAFPRISFQIELKGGTDVDYRIIEKPAFTIALMSRQFSNVDGQNLVEIPKWWEEFLASPDCEAMTALAGDKPGAMTGGVMLGICYGEVDTGSYDDQCHSACQYGKNRYVTQHVPVCVPFEKGSISVEHHPY